MSNLYVGAAKESSYGSYVAPTSFLEATSESLKLERAFDMIETFRGFSTREIIELNRIVRGDTEFLANYDGMLWLYKYLIGSTDYTTASPQHTFPASTGIPATDRDDLSLSLTVRRDDSLYWRYTGMKPISFNHVFGVDAAQRVTASWLGKDESTQTTGATPTYPTLKPIDPADASIVLDGGAALAATSVSINIENPLDELFILGSKVLGREPVRNGVLKVTWSAEVIFEDFTAYYNKFDGVTDVDVAAACTNGTETITYNMDKCRILQATPPVSGRDRLKATLEGESFYNTDATENLQVLVVNTETTSEP